MTRAFNDAGDINIRRLSADLDQAATGAAPSAAPALITDGGDCREQSTVGYLVYNSVAGAAGTCSLVPWYWIPVQQDPAGGVATYAWIRGAPISAPMTATGEVSKIIDVDVTLAERLYVQLVPTAAGLGWVRADAYQIHERSETQVVHGNGITMAQMKALLWGPVPIPVDTELTLDGGTIKIDNLFSASSDGAATGATWFKIDDNQRTEVARQEGRATVLDACDAIGAWQAGTAGTANVAVTTEHVWGTGALEFDKQAGDVVASVEHTIAAVNLNDFDQSGFNDHDVVTMAMHLASLGDVVNVFLRLGTDNANYNQWTWLPADLTTGAWSRLSKEIAAADSPVVGNGFNPAAVTYIVVGVTFNGAGDTLADIRVDDIKMVDLPSVIDPTQLSQLARLANLDNKQGTTGEAADPAGTRAAQLRAIANNLLGGVTVIQACDDNTEWAAVGGGTANLADALEHVWGTGSVEFDKQAGATFAGIDDTIAPIDLSHLGPKDVLAWSLYFAAIVDVNYAVLRLGTDNANYNEWRVEELDLAQGVWNTCAVRFGDTVAAVVGNGMDPTAITYVAIGVEFDAAGDLLANLRVDEIRAVSVPTTIDPTLIATLRELLLVNARLGVIGDAAAQAGSDAAQQRWLTERAGTTGEAASATGSAAAQLRAIAEGASGARIGIQDCDDNTDWAATGAAGNLATDLAHIWGVASVSFDKQAGGTEAAISDTITSIDLSSLETRDKLGWTLYLPDLTDVDYVFLRLGDGGNFNEWRVPGALLRVGYNALIVTINDSLTTSVGNGWNPAAVTFVEVGVVFDAVGDLLAGILVDEIYAMPVVGKGLEVTARATQPEALVDDQVSRLVTLLTRELVIAGYRWAEQHVAVAEDDPLDAHHQQEVPLVDETNLAGPATYRYEFEMGDNDSAYIWVNCSGGVTCTLWSTADPDADTTADTGWANETSFGTLADALRAIHLPNAKPHRWMLKAITVDATNVLECRYNKWST